MNDTGTLTFPNGNDAVVPCLTAKFWNEFVWTILTSQSWITECVDDHLCMKKEQQQKREKEKEKEKERKEKKNFWNDNMLPIASPPH